MLKISIPKPCHEDWNSMTPDQHGRHCSICAKTVVDFTGMDDAAVQHYFLNRNEGSTCGRFKKDQLSRITISLPADILQIKLPKWKQFLAACLLAFSSMLFSCDAVVSQGETPDGILAVPVTDTNIIALRTLGMPIAIIDTLHSQKLNHQEPVASRSMLTGDTLIVEPSIVGDFEVVPVENLSLDIIKITQADSNLIRTKSLLKQTGTVNSMITISDSAQTKNPPPADSIKCDINSTNYL